MIQAAYLADPAFQPQLVAELERAGVAVATWHGDLALSPDPAVAAIWALDVWTDVRETEAPSIKSAADTLRAVQRNWSPHLVAHHRRGALITARLPTVSAKPLAPGMPAPAAPLGGWTLTDPDRLLFSPAKTSPFPDGRPRFIEDHIGPPSRAYLKLWDAFVRWGAWPEPGQSCIDLGAAPGGWTWVMAMLGASVTAIDRAPLAPSVAVLPGVTWRAGNAFALPPEATDWLVCDVVAYPAATLELLERWIASGLAGRIVCTVKFQGDTDFAALDACAALGAVAHLAHNKHEVTVWWERSTPRRDGRRGPQ